MFSGGGGHRRRWADRPTATTAGEPTPRPLTTTIPLTPGPRINPRSPRVGAASRFLRAEFLDFGAERGESVCSRRVGRQGGVSGVAAFVVDALPGGGQFDGHSGALGAGVGRLLPARRQPGRVARRRRLWPGRHRRSTAEHRRCARGVSWSTPPVTSPRGCRGWCGREDRRGMLPGPRQPLPFRGPRSAVGHRRGDRPTPAGQNRRPQVGCYSFDRSLPPAAGNGTFWRRTWPSATALPSSRTTLTLHSCSVRPC